MAEKVSIFIEGAPSPFGHFSQVIKFGNSLHISGQLPLNPETGKLASTDITEQSRLVFQHFTSIMQACAGQLSHILSTRVYLIDLRDYPAFDKVSRETFFFVPPARTVLQVAALPFGARIMIDATAELKPIETKVGSLL